MESPVGDARNADQIAYWNGSGGARWTAQQASQDILLAPILDILIDRAGAKPGHHVLDVGCGCGATTIALAQRVAPQGLVVGIDVSAPMLARARKLAPRHLPLKLVLADATVYPFDSQSFDLLVSRFGVMFFAEPAVAFTNLRRALRQDGRVAFACWREPRHNPWMMLSLQAAYRHVPRLPEAGPDDPGPFALALATRLRDVLGRAGFSRLDMEPHDLSLDIAVGGGLERAVEGALQIGPASRALQDASPQVRDAARNSIREALAPFARGQSVPLPASIWMVTAHAS